MKKVWIDSFVMFCGKQNSDERMKKYFRQNQMNILEIISDRGFRFWVLKDIKKLIVSRNSDNYYKEFQLLEHEFIQLKNAFFSI